MGEASDGGYARCTWAPVELPDLPSQTWMTAVQRARGPLVMV